MRQVNSVSWGSRVLNLGSRLLIAGVLSFLPLRATAAELAEIEARGHLTIAVKDNLRPLGFEDAQGNLKGFEIDLARRLAQEIVGDPNAVRLQPVMNRDRLDVVLIGEVDLTIAHVSQTSARSRLVTFSPHYYLNRIALVTKDPNLNVLSEVKQGKIAVLNQSSAIAEVRFRLPQAQLIGVNSYQEALSLLEAGEAVAFAGDETVLAGWIQDYPQYNLLSERMGGEALAVVMPKGLQYSPLHQLVNETIRQLKQSGWLQQKAEEWGLSYQ
ncbi:amino acid ABC transporter substrate-binding protein, PAAT family [Halothece sp. PCC 7418]|uniref:transporter substrate-binding domain-containing protein n=1 Tax=Halothece sp. (strain PCC 7418) TaxID=65093 RepID=UPI0002A06455|nr:transporter substrate-binding domain-containing protein [Halothece sp. PCC 7418]AFZ44767.1 amino acid ABC transporter substrate-binding protein, PAAT family [Halothece sp. PCC 7418]